MKKTIIVTGCAGFIGSHMVDLLLADNYHVLGVDCFTYAGKTDNIKHHYGNPSFEILNVDICDNEDIFSVCQDYPIEWIINFCCGNTC